MIRGVARFTGQGGARSLLVRQFTSGMSEAEASIQKKLQDALSTLDVSVTDTSGGCGTMYDIQVKSDEFTGKSIIKQHKMVTQVIQEEIKTWHGFVLNTKAPKKA